MKAKYVLSTIVLLAVVAACVSGCGAGGEQNSLQRIKKADTVVVGMNGSAPYAFFDPETGEPTGFEIDVVTAVMKELGVDNVEVKMVNWEALIPGLQAGRFDIIASGMWITAPREEQVNFCTPISRFGSVIVVEPGNPKGITKWEDIDGLTVGMDLGQGDYDTAVEAGAEVKTYTKGLPEIAADLHAGRVDAIVYDGLYTTIQLDKNPDLELEIVAETPNVMNSGHAFRKEDVELLEAYNEELKKLQDDGTVFKILQEYGLSEMNLPK